MLEAKNELKEAEALYRRAVATGEAAHGPTHLHTKNYVAGLLIVLHAKGGCEAEFAALRAAHGI